MSTPSLPKEIRATIHEDAIQKVSRFFNATTAECLNELLQNSRRSGATRVDITLRANTVTVTDDGESRTPRPSKPPTASTTRLWASQAFQSAFSSSSDPLFRATGPNNNPHPRPHIPFRPLWRGFPAFQGTEPCLGAACTHPPPLRAATSKSAWHPGRPTGRTGPVP